MHSTSTETDDGRCLAAGTGIDARAERRAAAVAALAALLRERRDLQGVHALADHLDHAVRWSI